MWLAIIIIIILLLVITVRKPHEHYGGSYSGAGGRGGRSGSSHSAHSGSSHGSYGSVSHSGRHNGGNRGGGNYNVLHQPHNTPSHPLPHLLSPTYIRRPYRNRNGYGSYHDYGGGVSDYPWWYSWWNYPWDWWSNLWWEPDAVGPVVNVDTNAVRDEQDCLTAKKMSYEMVENNTMSMEQMRDDWTNSGYEDKCGEL